VNIHRPEGGGLGKPEESGSHVLGDEGALPKLLARQCPGGLEEIMPGARSELENSSKVLVGSSQSCLRKGGGFGLVEFQERP